MKKQEKLVTRWAPANLLDTRRAEGWLEKMAAQGLIYRRQSSWNAVTGVLFRSCPHIFLAQFHREEPRPLRRYRLVPAPRQGRPHPEQLELYAQSGWQYADYIDLFYTSFLLFFSDDPGAVEPYTDPDSFSLAYRFPLRGLVAALLLLGGFSVLSSALSLQLAGDSTTLLAVLSSWGGAIGQVLALLFALAVLVNLVLDARAVGLIRRQVQERQTTRPTLPETLFSHARKATSFYGTFQECPLIPLIPERLFENTVAADIFRYTFYGCTSVKEIPASLFANCTNATSFYGTFQRCTGLTAIPGELFSNNTSVTSFGYVFNGCTGIETLPENLFSSCRNATTFTSAFSNCTSLKTVPTGIFDMNKSVRIWSSTFNNCTALTGESPYTEVDGVKVHLYEREDYPDIFATPTTTERCFANATGLSDYQDIPAKWL